MAVGVDLRGDLWLLIDQIGEVLRLPDDGREENPVNLVPAWPSSPAAFNDWTAAHVVSTSIACRNGHELKAA